MRIPFTKHYACSGTRKHTDHCIIRKYKAIIEAKKSDDWKKHYKDIWYCGISPFYWYLTTDWEGKWILAESNPKIHGYLATYKYI